MVCRYMEVGKFVVSVLHAFHHSSIDTVLNHHRGKRSPGNQRLPDNHMTPSRGHSIRADPNLHPMRMHWTIVATLHIILSWPHELYRSVSKTLRDDRRFHRYM